jgi:hypothetical protein
MDGWKDEQAGRQAFPKFLEGNFLLSDVYFLNVRLCTECDQ